MTKVSKVSNEKDIKLNVLSKWITQIDFEFWKTLDAKECHKVEACMKLLNDKYSV